MRDALEFHVAGRGFVFLEVLSPCTLSWGTMDDASKTFDFLERKLASYYPVKRY